MIAYRQRGFVSFYTVVVGGFALALFLAYEAALPWVPRIDLAPGVNRLPYLLAVAVGVVASGRLFRPYAHRLHALHGSECLSLAFWQTVYVGASIFALMFATKDREISRLFLGSYLLLLLGGLTLLHGRFPRAFARMLFADANRARTLFVCRTSTPAVLEAWARAREHLGIEPVGYLMQQAPTKQSESALPCLGGVAQLGLTLRERSVNQVILLEWLDDLAVVERIIATCEAEGCRVLIHNDFSSRFARQFVAVQEGGQHFLTVQEEPLEDPTNRALKRLLDLAVAVPVVIVLLPPLTLLVWLVQRWQSPGPVFFAKARGGQGRREFHMVKFRSMRVDNPDIAKQATADDDRIYPFGRFLRKTSLDEIPQFLNVLLGQMSVVGPRPHLPQHDEAFSQIDHSYRIRSLVKPGITGLAQIKGFRGEITEPEKLHQRVHWDLYYVTNWSIWMDVRIVLRTVWVVLFPPKTAY